MALRFPLSWMSISAAGQRKAKPIWRRSWETRRQVEAAIFDYTSGLNTPRRRHSALEWKKAVSFERKGT